MKMRYTVTLCGFILLTAVGCNGPPTSAIAGSSPKIRVAKASVQSRPSPITYGVLISIDGLGARYLKPLLNANRLPGLSKLAASGAFTHDGRSDPDNTTTLPNHTCMLTGLPVAPQAEGSAAYHGFTYNRDPLPMMTLHNSGNTKLGYVPSIFDVAHDFGKKTCLFSGKSKFIIYDRSYDETHGAKDMIGADNGRDKIDVNVINSDTSALLEAFVSVMTSKAPCHLVFFHIADPDAAGHRFGWGNAAWQQSVVFADGVVLRILNLISTRPELKERTALVVTADHGGQGLNHGDNGLAVNFTVPFYLMAPGIPAGADLYKVFAKTRRRWPGQNPRHGVSPPPIRNGDAGNLLLQLLGLPPVPGAVMFDMVE